MPSIVKKRIKGHPYYYLVETAWKDGRSRIVHQQYLGKPADIARAVAQRGGVRPHKAAVGSYGAVAALYRQAESLDVVGIIDQHAPKRRQGPSVGQYLLLAAINRATFPTSKAGMLDWYNSTCLRHWLPFRDPQLKSQRFWDHMGYLTAERIAAIENELTQKMVQTEGLDLSSLIFDATNFYTWIDTMADAELPQRGHNKAKRHDLKQVSLAMLVTTDFHIPLLHHVYPGNRNDVSEFGSVIEGLLARYHALAGDCKDVTLIFDKGNNSKDNLRAVDGAPLHFVGSLVPSRFPDLLAVPRSQFVNLDGPAFGGTSALRVSRDVFGAQRTLVVTYNEALYLGQLQGLLLRVRKANDALRQLQRSLAMRAPRPATDRPGATMATNVEARIQKVLAQAVVPLKDWLRYSITEREGRCGLTYTIDHEAQQAYCDRHLGKHILFTDRQDWTNEQVVAAYRSQSTSEDAFREMKHPHCLGWQPMFHWTDDKIRVHALYCVLALTLTALLRRRLARQGVAISAPALIAELSAVQQVAHIYPDDSGIPSHLTFSETTPLQDTLMRNLHLLPPAPSG